MDELLTARLRIRPIVLTDREFLVELDADPRVREHLDIPVPPTLADADGFIARVQAVAAADPRWGYGIIELRTDGTPIGWAHLRPSRIEPTTPEIGYRLAAAHWGRGYATEVAQRLVARTFDGYGLKRVVATTLEANIASQRVMERAGLRREGSFLHDGRLPALIFGLDATSQDRNRGD